VYDGTTSSSGTPTFGTLFGTDSASFTQAFLSKDVLGLNGSTLLASGSVNDGNQGRDYTISFVSAKGTITPASLTIAANNATQLQGAPQPAFTASFSGFPSGLGTSALNGTLTFSISQIPGMPGSFEVLPGGLSSSNFAITFVPGTLVVTPANSLPGNVASQNAANDPSNSANSATETAVNEPTTENSSEGGASNLANFTLPPVPFAMDTGIFVQPRALSLLDPVVASLVYDFERARGAENGDMRIPKLDENGNPIGGLIGFNSTFIETCRARANLCR
jgi:hypothetical protein